MVAVRRSSLADAMTSSVKRQTVQFLNYLESFPGLLQCTSKPSSTLFSCCIFYTYFIIDIIDDVDSSIFNALLSYIIRHDNSLSIISKGG